MSSFLPNKKKNAYAAEKPLIAFDYQGSPEEVNRLIHMVNTVAANSVIGREVLEKAASNGYQLLLETQDGSYGYADPDQKQLVLHPAFNDQELITTLVHEARHAGQFANGIKVNFGALNVKSELIKYRMMEADADACAAVAWLEMEKNGIIRKPMRRPEIAITDDMRAAFENAPLNENLQLAFNEWFKDDKIKTSYENSYLLGPMRTAMAVSENSYLSLTDYSALAPMNDGSYKRPARSADFIDAICTLNGKCYFDNKNVMDDMVYLDICPATKDALDTFFAVRYRDFGVSKDTSYADLPIRTPLSLKERLEKCRENRKRYKAERKEWRAEQKKKKTTPVAAQIAAEKYAR